MHLRAVRRQDLRNQQSQFSIAENGHASSLRHSNLIQNLARGGYRLDKYGLVVGDPRRNRTQILERQRQKLAKRAGMLHNPQHRAMRAMPAQIPSAPFAVAAR